MTNPLVDVLLGTPKDIPKSIWSSDRKAQGQTTGKWKHCSLSGCAGFRYGVRWPDGRITWPCSKGLVGYCRGWRIG